MAQGTGHRREVLLLPEFLYAAHEDEAIARQEEGNDDAEYWHGVADAFSAAGFLMWQECDDAE
jgi:hypothetical protein